MIPAIIRRSVAVWFVVALAMGVLAAPAFAGGRQVLADYEDNGQINGCYTLAEFEEAGVNLRTYDDETLRALHEVTVRVMERKSGEDEMFGKVYASMMEFQRELAPWKELGYLPRSWLRENVYEAE